MNRDLRWYMILLGGGFFLATPLRDNDLFWHLSVGRWIITQQQLPSQDYWTMIGEGHPWIPYSWLFELVVGAVNAVGGLSLLVWLQALVAVGYALVLGATYQVLSGSLWFSLGLSSAIILGSAGHFALRPQSIVWILFCLLVGTLEKNKNSTRTTSYHASILLITLLWSNIHLSALFALITIALWGVSSLQELMARWRLLLGATIMTFITPHGGGEWRALIESSTHPLTHRIIAEFQPAHLTQYPAAILFLLWIVLVLIAGSVKKLPGGTWFVILGMTTAGVIANKFIPFALIVVGAGIAQSWKLGNIDTAHAMTKRFRLGIEALITRIMMLPAVGLSFLIACGLYIKSNKLLLEAVDSKSFPKEVEQYITTTGVRGTVLASFGMGGYVQYQIETAGLNEVAKVAFDGRTNVIPAEVWKEIEDAERDMGTKGAALIERFRPQYIVWQARSPFVSYSKEQGWTEVLRSQLTKSPIVLLKRNS